MITEWLEATSDILPASNGNEVRIDCPFCEARSGTPDTKHHMYVNLTKPVAFCFRCGWSGHHVSLVMGMTGGSYAEAIKALDNPVNIADWDMPKTPSGISDGAIFPSKPVGFHFLRPSRSNASLEERAVWNYLIRKRKLDAEIVHKRMGYVAGTNRAWILVDHNYWQGRLITPGEPKYMNPPWPKGDSLWNAQALENDHIYLCEGVISALAVGMSAVAILGKMMTEPQVMRIVKSRVHRITIMLDKGAERDAEQAAMDLERAGYRGQITIHNLFVGDPTDGLSGTEDTYDWMEVAKRRLHSGNGLVM